MVREGEGGTVTLVPRTRVTVPLGVKRTTGYPKLREKYHLGRRSVHKRNKTGASSSPGFSPWETTYPEGRKKNGPLTVKV